MSIDRLRAALRLGDGETPFPWQQALLDRFINGDLPRALDIPTGLGKTSVMAIWLVARAAGAPVPRRLVYVVDRRAVVDQSTAVAEQLRCIVAGDPAFQQALGLEQSLPISTLRGQYADNRQWLEDPSSPAIILGTVDMIGSRLLFSGYGVSRKMRPYHAGLLGADSLIVLDEAHLVPPFERLIEQIATGVDGTRRSPVIVPPLRFMSLSATGRTDHTSLFGLTDADLEHPAVKKRLGATKRLSIAPAVSDKDLPEALSEAAWKLTAAGTKPARIIVFCSSRDHAQKVQADLEARARSGAIETELFVGGRRVFERDNVAAWLSERGFIAGTTNVPAHATFVISTAAGEVGVDLDADHAVCDVVAWERMVQRLGRVNRRGNGSSQVIVLPALADDKTPPELAERRSATLEVIGHLRRAGDAHDASPGGLLQLRARAELRPLIDRATTPPLLHPPLTRAALEAWSMTSVEDHTGRPEVAPWIRGWDDAEEPQTTVVWREALPVTDGGTLFSPRDLEAFRDAADPHLAEKLEVETWRVAEWLVKRCEASPISSQDSTRASLAVVVYPSDGRERALRPHELEALDRRDLTRMLAGATLLVDIRLGGLQNGLLSDDSNAAATDVSAADDSQSRVVPFRIRRIEAGADATLPKGWRTEASFPLATSETDHVPILVVESLVSQLASSENGRSAAARAQDLDEHQAWTEAEAKRLASRLKLGDYAGVLSLSAVLHDEGKRAERWQRAFGVPRGQPPLAKTTSRPNLRLLDHYRHELGSLPYAEAHRDVQSLPAELRELCLHLIAAHHGGARPLLCTDGAPDPPSRLRERAQQIALRFASLEDDWGPWGLAWWETLLRAADQRASRRNDAEGAAHG